MGTDNIFGIPLDDFQLRPKDYIRLLSREFNEVISFKRIVKKAGIKKVAKFVPPINVGFLQFNYIEQALGYVDTKTWEFTELNTENIKKNKGHINEIIKAIKLTKLHSINEKNAIITALKKIANEGKNLKGIKPKVVNQLLRDIFDRIKSQHITLGLSEYIVKDFNRSDMKHYEFSSLSLSNNETEQTFNETEQTFKSTKDSCAYYEEIIRPLEDIFLLVTSHLN